MMTLCPFSPLVSRDVGGWVVDFGNLKVGLIHVMKEKKCKKRIMQFEPTLFSLYIPSANRFSES